MKYIAIFNVPDDYNLGCASAKIAPKGKDVYSEDDYKDAYAQIEPLSDEKTEVFERFNAVNRIMDDLGLSNAYDMPSFWTSDRKNYKVIPTQYHKGYRQALEDMEKEIRNRFGFAERDNILDVLMR